MRLVIPFAGRPPGRESGDGAGDGPGAAPGWAPFAVPPLPNLAALLARLDVVARDDGDEWSLSPPHERALARALGWQGSDGRLPWAARQARADGIDPGDIAIGLMTPAHWHLGTHQVSLVDPAALALGEDESRTLYEAVRGLFLAEGFGVAFGAADRWYLMHESLAVLATASLDRVIGRNVDRWLGSDPAARRIRRLQSEVQMTLHAHPLNAAREGRGLLPVNSFWLSGCGVAQSEVAGAAAVDDRLRGPALASDAAGWALAWQTLDAGPIAELRDAAGRGERVELTLCGERSGVTFAGGGAGGLAGGLSGGLPGGLSGGLTGGRPGGPTDGPAGGSGGGSGGGFARALAGIGNWRARLRAAWSKVARSATADPTPLLESL